MLSVVIVNYFSADLLHDCIDSVYKHTPGFPFEIIIANNGCAEEDKHGLLKKFPGLLWIDAGYNAGFARANNMGIRLAKGELILLLNPDTIAIDNSIQRCYERLQNSDYVAAGVQLLNADGIPQISGSHFVKGGLNHLLPIPYLGSFIRWLGYALKTQPPGVEQATATEEVDWISGAFLMVKKRVVDAVGLLDEDFFLYAEEVEWCSRIKKAGKLCIYGDLRIIHLEGATIDRFSNAKETGYYNLYDKKGLQLMVSNHVRVRKQYGAGWFLFLLLNYTFGVLVFAVAGTIHQIITLKSPVRLWKRLGAFTRNVLTVWQLSPTIIRNKPHFYKMF